MRLHKYTSTACHHGHHKRCVPRCEFCAELCRCACHREAKPVRAGSKPPPSFVGKVTVTSEYSEELAARMGWGKR